MSGTPRPPLFLVYFDDSGVPLIDVCDSTAQVAGYLEPPEFRQGGYHLYDSDGRVGDLAVERWDIVVRDWSEALYESELKNQLARYLANEGEGVDPTWGLDELVHKTVPIVRRKERRGRWSRLPRFLRKSR